ncbi:MAG: Rpn family recombination-promoting nuclease/putative transposase [Isosphaeraceae bacterium]
MDHDQSYKLLFTHREMVIDLLRGFVRQDWVEKLDFSSLEKLNSSYVTRDLREREGDVVWRVRFQDQWLYVYLLIEFQSTVDRFMALQLLVYVGLLYQELVQTKQVAGDGLLPPVLPLVLYNGDRPWNAPEDVSGLIASVPGDLDRYRPRLRYLLLDEGRYAESELATLSNLVAALFRLENSRTLDDVRQVLDALAQWLNAPEQASLHNAFTVWMNKVLLPRRMPGVEFIGPNDLQEVRSMLANRVAEWTEQWKQDGLHQGLHQGLQQGRQEAGAELLLRLLEHRFAPLEEAQRARIQSADLETIHRWADRLLTAQSVDEVIATP